MKAREHLGGALATLAYWRLTTGFLSTVAIGLAVIELCR